MTFFHSIWRGLTMARNVAANILFLIILLIILFAIFGGSGKVGLPDKFALELDLEGVLVERATPLDPLNQLLDSNVQSETVLGDIEDLLSRAATDDRVSALVINTTNLLSANLVQIERIRVGIDAVKQAGKPVLAMGFYFTQPQYLIASQADELYLHPMGEAMLTGLATSQPYFASALSKLEIDVHVFRVGKFKSAVEPFLRDSISPEAAEASRALLTQLWSSYRRKIALNRGLDETAVDDFVNQLPDAVEQAQGDVARLAVESRLVDELLTPDGFNARVAQAVGVEPDELQRVTTPQYVGDSPLKLPESGPQVAVITAVGGISGGTQGQVSEGIVAKDIIELIRKAKDDDDVKALVLHVDSPGGEALASELIRQELELIQLAGKPVVAAMAGVAASGGYWISATADRIIASPDTITGSIGIFGVLPNLNRALGNAGVNFDGVSSHDIAGGLSLVRPLSEDMSRVIQSSINQGYDRFITLVARGRDLERAQVEEIAEGRVWAGAQALELGLVDQLGNLEDAITAAAELAGVSNDYSIKPIDPALTPREQLLRQLMGKNSATVQWLEQIPGATTLKLLVRAAKDYPASATSQHKQILAVCETCDPIW